MSVDGPKFQLLREKTNRDTALIFLQETHSRSDIVFEKIPGLPHHKIAIHSGTLQTHDGVMVLTNDDIIVQEASVLIPGRVVAVRFSYLNAIYVAINCYLDASNNPGIKRTEIQTINTFLENSYRAYAVEKIIVAGDFNINLNQPNRIHDAIFRPFLVRNYLIDFPKIAFLNENVTRRGGGRWLTAARELTLFWPRPI